MQKSYKILISGQVQGVGFRPYVYRLARKFLLTGTVSNNEDGVIIFVSGLERDAIKFYNEIIQFPPPVSRIKNSKFSQTENIGFNEFKIVSSKKNDHLNLSLTPDFAICNNCKDDIVNQENKRFNYPFTTCVNCGPRWAITETFPFERNHTSIDNFPMCLDCINEYTNPSNRRFHSQTNTCKTCGIDLFLLNRLGNELKTSKGTLFKKVASLLSEGKIIAIKNTSGYLLCCNAENKKVVQQLRNKKNRPNKPFAVLYPSLIKLKNELPLKEVHVSSLNSTERPINIVSLNNFKGNIALNEVAPGLCQLGVMLPYSGILQLLSNELSFPVVATSGNIHGSPILSNQIEAHHNLKHVADYFLHHNLNIVHPQDDSVIKFGTKHEIPCLFRRSRGFAPNYLNARLNTNKKLLALGADLKSSFAFFPNKHLYISQYLGNLENFDVYERLRQEIKANIKIFQQIPDTILADTHPNYQSVQLAKNFAIEMNVKLVQIQHHKAHFASVLGENNLFNKKALGVVWDGTGYGEDNTIWGGEFFIYSNGVMKRQSHFEYFNWIAGDKMAKEPRLSLLSLDSGNDADKKFSSEELSILRTVEKTNQLKTSSVGRLFDAVASLLNICDYNTYEGEAAILLENKIKDYNLNRCVNYCRDIEFKNIPTKLIIEKIKQEIRNGVKVEQIICNFLFTLALSIYYVANQCRVKTICCSGGVFQNTTLIDMLIDLNKSGHKLYFNRNLAPNDENISFGQIMYYVNCKE